MSRRRASDSYDPRRRVSDSHDPRAPAGTSTLSRRSHRSSAGSHPSPRLHALTQLQSAMDVPVFDDESPRMYGTSHTYAHMPALDLGQPISFPQPYDAVGGAPPSYEHSQLRCSLGQAGPGFSRSNSVSRGVRTGSASRSQRTPSVSRSDQQEHSVAMRTTEPSPPLPRHSKHLKQPHGSRKPSPNTLSTKPSCDSLPHMPEYVPYSQMPSVLVDTTAIGERGYVAGPQERTYPPAERSYPPAERGYPPPDRGYPPPDRGYPPPDRGYAPPDRGYAHPERSYAPAPQQYVPVPPGGFNSVMASSYGSEPHNSYDYQLSRRNPHHDPRIAHHPVAGPGPGTAIVRHMARTGQAPPHPRQGDNHSLYGLDLDAMSIRAFNDLVPKVVWEGFLWIVGLAMIMCYLMSQVITPVITGPPQNILIIAGVVYLIASHIVRYHLHGGVVHQVPVERQRPPGRVVQVQGQLPQPRMIPG